jgi:hypothetical protein
MAGSPRLGRVYTNITYFGLNAYAFLDFPRADFVSWFDFKWTIDRAFGLKSQEQFGAWSCQMKCVFLLMPYPGWLALRLFLLLVTRLLDSPELCGGFGIDCLTGAFSRPWNLIYLSFV